MRKWILGGSILQMIAALLKLLRIGKPMSICFHRKDNSLKLVNHRLTLKEGPKVKSDHSTRFPVHDFQQVGLPSQTSRTNNKQVISTFKFGYPRLILKEGSKVKSDNIERFTAHDFRLVLQCKPLGPIIREI